MNKIIITTFEYRINEPNGVPPSANGYSNPIPGFSGWNDFFKDVCNKHDICYDTCGYTQQNCDLQFYDLMVKQCQSNASMGEDTVCIAVATSYFLAVSTQSSYFDNSQDNVCKKDTCEKCSFLPGSTPIISPGG